MATWFAQNSTVNIDSVNQWNSAANGSGSWLTWASLGASDILVANNKSSITINVSFTCATITTAATGGTAGGGFIWPGNVSIVANIAAGTTTVLTPSGSGTRTIVGNLTGGTGTGSYCLATTSDLVTITGNIIGASSNTADGRVINNCTNLAITGNVTGGSTSGNNNTINLDGTGTIVITGNVIAGTAANAIYLNSGTLTLTVVGTIYTTTNSMPAVRAVGTLNLRHTGDQIAASNGTVPVSGNITNFLISASSAIYHEYRVNNAGSPGVARSLYTGGVNLGQPAVANVRSGTAYGASSEYTGTLAVPSPTLVAIGVATDNTVGSYAPSGASAADVADAVWDEARSGHVTAGTFGENVVAELDSADKATLVDLIWDEPLTGATHNVATSSGKRLRQTTAFQQIDSTVIDAAATTTTFITGLTSSVDNFYNDSMLVFTDGALAGQVRAIYDYIGATKTIVLEEALTSAPVDGVAFAVVSLHIHPVSQIQSGLATSAALVTLRGADNDTLKTLSDQIDTVSADVSSIASVSREAF
jgi:hypothetical protein